MQGKYTTRSAYLKAKLRRGVIRAMIRPLAKWSRIASPEPGYSLVIACHAALARLALPSLELAARQDLTDLKETIIALDGRSTDYTRKFEDDARRIAPALNISFIYQSPRESWVCRKINWGWVDCWLSYCKALAAVKTKWAMLHDMDAMLLTPTVFRERHEAIRTRGDQYLGYRWYNGNGVAREDQIAYIVEMILDAQFVRERFRPIDLFNNVTLFKGRTIDFDTMLYPQVLAGRASILPIEEELMVHPSQVISQYTYLKSNRPYVAPAACNLFFIPYFLYLGGDETVLEQHRAAMAAHPSGAVPFMGHAVDLSKLTSAHVDWIVKQTVRLETALAGEVRPAVRAYLDVIELRVKQST